MTVEECIEVAEANSDRKGVPMRPTRAADVAAEPTLSPQEQRRAKAVAAVRSRRARQEGLRRAGADVPTSSPDLAARLEDSLRRRDQRAAAEFRAGQG